MYIIDNSSISAQESYKNSDYLQKLINHQGVKIYAAEPDYTGIIEPGQLRRMGKALRMGIASGLSLIKKHSKIDGIIIGTANGGLEGAMNFLNQIVDYDEGTLTPTNFIQSTPNNIAGQLAIMTNNINYNITHTNGALAFENALIDALLLLNENPKAKYIVGSVEEISKYNFNIDKAAGFYKDEEVELQNLLNIKTKGTVGGEGATMFVVTNEVENRDEYSKIIEVETLTEPDYSDVIERIDEILERHNIQISEIDAVLMGFNGDYKFDEWYRKLIEERFFNNNILSFKNLVGDYQTVSAFALKMANDILLGEKYSNFIEYKKKNNSKINSILIYNHFWSKQHSIMVVANNNFLKNKDII